MLTQTHWKETFEYEPWNPAQRGVVHYTGLPGGYSTFYYNQIPNTTTLVGPELPRYMDPQSGETITVVPPVFGQAEQGYSAKRLALYAALAAVIGAGAGYLASRVV
jgi:hypothetical protein